MENNFSDRGHQMNEFQKKILAMQIQQAQGSPCILCGKRSDGAGAFLPDKEFAAKIGQPKGKLRMIVYALCSRCQRRKKNLMEKVEQQILSDYLAMNGNRQN